jgi:hypothetical protein
MLVTSSGEEDEGNHLDPGSGGGSGKLDINTMEEAKVPYAVNSWKK